MVDRGMMQRTTLACTMAALLVALKLYFNDRGVAKVDLGLGRGKRSYDKRRDIADRDAQRDAEREWKRRR